MLDKATILRQLRQWSTCDIADSLLKLNHPHGGFLEGLILYSPQFQSGPTRIAGQVYTVKLVPKSDIVSPKLLGHYMDGVPKDAVIFLSQPTPHINAVFGGLMALRAQQVGAAGAVVDGRLRDLQEHRDLEFPVFAKGVSTTAGGEVCRASQVNVPIKLNSAIQEAWVVPGDYIVADLNGVVCIPEALLEDTLKAIPEIVEADKGCADGIKRGRKVEEVFKEFRGT